MKIIENLCERSIEIGFHITLGSYLVTIECSAEDYKHVKQYFKINFTARVEKFK